MGMGTARYLSGNFAPVNSRNILFLSPSEPPAQWMNQVWLEEEAADEEYHSLVS